MTEAGASILVAVAEQVAQSRDDLNRLDAVAGDGDLGLTMSAAADALTRVASLPHPDRATLLRACGLEIARVAPSTCGTLIATGFLAASRVSTEPPSGPVSQLARQVSAAQAGIEQRGKARRGDRTMLDALAPAVEALERAAAEGLELKAALELAADAARAGAEQTAEMQARAGRALWVGERAQGYLDAGASLVAVVFEAAARLVADSDAACSAEGERSSTTDRAALPTGAAARLEGQ